MTFDTGDCERPTCLAHRIPGRAAGARTAARGRRDEAAALKTMIQNYDYQSRGGPVAAGSAAAGACDVKAIAARLDALLGLGGPEPSSQ